MYSEVFKLRTCKLSNFKGTEYNYNHRLWVEIVVKLNYFPFVSSVDEVAWHPCWYPVGPPALVELLVLRSIFHFGHGNS